MAIKKQKKVPGKRTRPKAFDGTAQRLGALLSSSLESVENGILIVDLKGKILFYSKKFLEMWGIPARVLRNRNDSRVLQYVVPKLKDFPKFIARVEHLYANPQQEGYDQIELSDGRLFIRYTRPHYQGRKIVGRVWSFRDNTQALQQEKALVEWKTRHELIVSSFGRVVYDYDVQKGAIRWSGNCEDVLGFSAEDLGDIKTWEDNIHPDDRAGALAELDAASEKVAPYKTQYRFRTKGGEYIWLQDIGFFLPDNQGKSVRMLGEMTDITNQIEADREIRHLASIPLQSPEIILEVNPDGSLSYGNPSFYEAVRRLGLRSHRPFLPPDTPKALTKKNLTWKSTAEVNIAGRTFSIKLFYLPEKEQTRLYAYDLTDRLEAERQKTDLELTYKTLFDSATDAIMLLDVDDNPGKILSANLASAGLYGYTLQDFLELRIQDLDIVVPGVHLTYEERIEKVIKSQRQLFEVLHRRRDGSQIPLEAVASIFELSGKRLQLAIMRDISERKKAEEEIKLQYRFIESLASASPDVVYVYDLETEKYVYGNQRMSEAYGYPLQQLLEGGHNLMRHVMHPEDADKIPQWIELLRVAHDGQVIESRFRLRDDSGWRTFQSRESVFTRNADGRVKQIIGSSIDITIQVQAEEALRESEHRFRALHEASFGGIAIHDMGIILECNNGLSRLTGYTYQELIGFNGLLLVHPDDRALVLEKIISQDEQPYDVHGIRKDGSVYALEVKGKPVPFQGRMMRVTEFRDITERIKAAESIKEQNTRLQAIAESLRFKNQQLDEFTQIVSHNLRAPAGNIISLTDFLTNAHTQEDQAKMYSLLRQSGNNILTTLSELNDVLKIKQNKNIEKQVISFEHVFKRVCDMQNGYMSSVWATVTGDFSEAPEIEYPHLYLESIFLNLLSNALKYHHPDRRPIITFKTHVVNGRVCLEVSDNGLGINLNRYGHQVFKMRKTFHNHPDSRGIGLFMIKNQVETMGGQIAVTSEEYVGSTFRVIF